MNVNTAWQQISRNTKMCVWATQPRDENGSLVFWTKVDNQRRSIRISLNGNDLYDVEQRLHRAGTVRVTFRTENIFCEDLDETVYRMGSTRSISDEKLAQWGIERVAA